MFLSIKATKHMNFKTKSLKIMIWEPKNRHFTPCGTHKWMGHLVCKWVWELKMVQEVIIDIDGTITNYIKTNLIHESQYNVRPRSVI